MNLLTALIIILSVILIPEMVVAEEQTAKDTNNLINGDVQTQSTTAYSKPNHIPALKPYIIDKSRDIWQAQDPSSYITPDNEWVKYHASLLYIDYDGRIRYKNRTVPLLVDEKANVLLWTDEPFLNNYSYDIYKQAYGFYDRDNIQWFMPDYYLTHGMTGVCSAWAVTVTSLMLSGEMSIKEKGQFVRTVVPAKAVLGYMGGYRDAWTEYQVYGKTFLTTTSLVNTGIEGQEKISSTEFVEKNEKNTMPIIEFTDEYFRSTTFV